MKNSFTFMLMWLPDLIFFHTKQLIRKTSLLFLVCFIFLTNSARSQNPVSGVMTYIESKVNNIDGVSGLVGISDVFVSPDGKFVYTASYQVNAVSAFERNAVTGKLTYKATISSVPAAFGVVLSPDDKHAYVASPTGSSIHALMRNQVTGNLTPIGIYNNIGGTGGFVSLSISSDGKWVYGVGGSPSGLVVFGRNAETGALSRLYDLKDGTNNYALGQFFSPTESPIKNIRNSADGKYLYVTSTLDNAVSVFVVNNDTGELTQQQVVIDGLDGVDGLQAASSLTLSPDGRFLFVAGQGENSIALFNVDPTNGTLSYVSKFTNGTAGISSLLGARSLAVSPDGRYLFLSSISSNTITAFECHPVTGALTFVSVASNGEGGVSDLNAPSGMATDPSNRHLYVAAQGSRALLVFALSIPAVELTLTGLTAPYNGTATPLDPSLNVYDSDSPNLASATVKIEEGLVSTDILTVELQSGISGSYDSANGTLHLSGIASLKQYTDVLRTVKFKSGEDANVAVGGYSTRSIAITVTDGENTSAAAKIAVKVERDAAVNPEVLSTDVPANGTYKIGDILSFTINLNEAVTVNKDGGTPRIALNIGSSTVYASYTGGSDSSALVFSYKIQPGDLDADGITLETALELNGGTIRNTTGNDAILTLTGVGSTTGILVDAVAPKVLITISAPSLKTGEITTVTFTFSEAVIGFDNADLTVESGKLSAVNSSDGGVTWTATFMPNADTEAATNVIMLYNAGLVDAAGNTGSGTTKSDNYAIDTKVPAIPVGLVVAFGDTENIISWTANGETDLASYSVFGGTSVNPTTLLSTRSKANLTYTHKALTNGVTYYYRILAVDLAGNVSEWSEEVNATPKTPQVITFGPLPTKTYGDADFDGDASSTNNSIVITYSSSNATVATIINGKIHIVGVGTADITASQAGSEAFIPAVEVTRTLTIKKAGLTVTADTSQTKVYGENDPAFTYTVAPALVNGDSFTGTLTRNTGENIGNYAITQGNLSAGANYNISYVSKDFAITAKPITVAATASQTKVYGTADPVFAYTVSPTLVGSDTFTGALTRAAGQNVGTYGIAQGSLSAGSNYTISYVSKDFAITAKPITVAATASQTKVYGTADPVFAYTVSPTLVGSDTFTGALTRAAGQNVGTYAIGQGSLSAGSNYTISYVSKDFSITAKPITVAATASQTKVYGTADPVFAYTVSSSLVSGDSFTGVLTRAAGQDVGAYAIGQGSLSAGANYTINYVSKDFTITKANQTITWNQTLELGCNGVTTAVLTASSSSGLAVSYTSSDTNIATISNGLFVSNNYGSATISASQAGNTNYNAAAVVVLPVVNSQPNLIRKQFEDIIFFDNSSKSFTSYSWYKNGVLVPSQTAQYFKENGALNGTYFAKATRLDGMVVTTCPLILSPTVEEEYIKIVPNPAKSNTAYELVTNVSSSRLQNARVEVYSVGGLLIENKTTSENKVVLKAPMAEGIYIVKMTLANGKYFTKNLLVKN